MDIVSARHKGLTRLLETNNSSGFRADMVPKLRRVLTALLSARKMDSLGSLPGWRLHQLKGNRAGTWSISITGNWRLTFKESGGTITELDLEDYH